MGTYSIFKVCLCQYGDANSSSNWRYDKGEYSVLNGVRMADICLASLVYLLVNLHFCTFASKQAVSITLFGPRPNNNYPQSIQTRNIEF